MLYLKIDITSIYVQYSIHLSNHRTSSVRMRLFSLLPGHINEGRRLLPFFPYRRTSFWVSTIVQKRYFYGKSFRHIAEMIDIMRMN